MDYMTLICGGIKDAQQKDKAFLSYTNSDGTNVQIFNLTNREMKTKKQIDCEACEGTDKVEESYDDFQLRRTAEREGLISEMINEDDLIQD